MLCVCAGTLSRVDFGNLQRHCQVLHRLLNIQRNC